MDTNGIGGIVGEACKSKINSSSNSGSVFGTQSVGGIGGLIPYTNDDERTTSAQIIKCYNEGNISGSLRNGGIVGWNGATNGGAIIQNCYNRGSISGTSKNGEIIGDTYTNGNTYNNLFYLRNSVEPGKAIGNMDDNTDEKIMPVDDNLTFEEFQTWIDEQ